MPETGKLNNGQGPQNSNCYITATFCKMKTCVTRFFDRKAKFCSLWWHKYTKNTSRQFSFYRVFSFFFPACWIDRRKVAHKQSAKLLKRHKGILASYWAGTWFTCYAIRCDPWRFGSCHGSRRTADQHQPSWNQHLSVRKRNCTCSSPSVNFGTSLLRWCLRLTRSRTQLQRRLRTTTAPIWIRKFSTCWTGVPPKASKLSCL